MRRWKGITIHHSLSHDVSTHEIDRWHKGRGWREIGYHFVIRKNGDIEPGRSLEDVGAHHLGKNSENIGICLTGNLNEKEPTQKQMLSVVALTRGLRTKFEILSDNSIVRHHEKCPGEYFPWDFFMREVNIEW